MDKEGDNMEAWKDNLAFEIEENSKCKDDPIKSYGTVVEKEPEEKPDRQQWSNPIEFLLSCIAMSVRSTTRYCQV